MCRSGVSVGRKAGTCNAHICLLHGAVYMVFSEMCDGSAFNKNGNDRRKEGMNLFHKLFSGKQADDSGWKEKTILCPVEGKVIPLSEVGDPVFAQGILGPGVGIEPEEGMLYAPVDGVGSAVDPTGPAVGLWSSGGAPRPRQHSDSLQPTPRRYHIILEYTQFQCGAMDLRTG